MASKTAKDTKASGVKSKTSGSRNFTAIDEVRKTYYPNALSRMERQRRQTGMERLDLGETKRAD